MSDGLLGLKRFSFIKAIAAADGDTDILAAAGAGKTHVLQKLNINLVLAAAQVFRIEDKGSAPQIFFTAPASLAAGLYEVDFGPLGLPFSEANVALEYDAAAAGPQLTISGYGYIRE